MSISSSKVAPGQQGCEPNATSCTCSTPGSVSSESESRSLAPRDLIHVFGSTSSKYYECVSIYYVTAAIENLQVEHPELPYHHAFLHAHPDGSWSVPEDLTKAGLDAAPSVPLDVALEKVRQGGYDCMIPHMFCMEGMTTVRGLFSGLLRIPMIGNGPAAMALSTNKWHTRAIMAAAGVPVAHGELLERPPPGKPAPVPKMVPPFIVKPNREDNSQGVRLFRGLESDDIQTFMLEAFQFDNQVICEAFVPLGHELRIAMVEDDDGEPSIMLPTCEYTFEEAAQPIRTQDDKLQTDSEGMPKHLTSGKCKRIVPADHRLSPELLSQLRKHGRNAHKALGCRDFSIYDIRVSPDGIPYFLEASLYCSFAATSITVVMDAAGSGNTVNLFSRLVERAVERKRKSGKKAARGQLLGLSQIG